MMEIILCVISLIVMVQLIIWGWRWFGNYSKVAHLKGISQVIYFPFRLPLLSPRYNLQDWKSLAQLSKTSGDLETRTLRVSMLYYNVLVVSDREMLKELFTSKQNFFEKPFFEYDMLSVFGENILTALRTESWKKHHTACNSAFNDDNLRYVCEKSVESVDLLFETKWNNLERDNDDCFIIEPNIDFSNVTLDVLGKAGFGFSFGIFSEDNEGRDFTSSLNYIVDVGLVLRRYILINFPYLYPLFCKLTGLDKAVDKVHHVLLKCINERKKDIERMGADFDHKDILSLLVKANIQDGLLTNDELISNAFVLSTAGFHTSSTTIQWTIYELSRNMEIQRKAREEVFQLLGRDGKAPLEDFEKFKYLNAVILESLRLHPPVTSVIKQVCKKEVTLGKFTLPKDTEVDIFIGGTHLDERYWNEPLRYDPKRFLNSDGELERRKDFSFIPFSMGIRKCIGFRFAEREICVVMSRLLQKYEFFSLSDRPVEENVGITVGPANLKIKVKQL